MNQIPCGYLVIDGSRVIIEANDEALRLLGKTRELTVGQRFSSLMPPGSRIFFQTHVFPELLLGGRVDELYLSLTTSRGELPVLLNAARRTSGDVTVYDVAFLPIYRRSLFERELIVARHRADEATASERKALAEIKNMQAQLTFADKLAAVGALAAGVAHEVNSPLTYVIANLEVLLAMLPEATSIEPSVKQQWTEIAGEALDGSLRIRNILGDLQLLSRNEVPPKHPVELGKVVKTALRLSSPSLKMRAHVDLDERDPGLVILGDEGRLVQVLVNLLVNAAQALPENTRGHNHVAVVVAKDESARAVVEVSDNGPGIPREIRTRIFDPFFTTKPQGSGTGLGLSVCHRIVTDLGGAIELNTEEGRGTTFRLVFPGHDSRERRHAS